MGLESFISGDDTEDEQPDKENKRGTKGYSDEELIAKMEQFYEENGFISSGVFNRDPDYPAHSTVQKHFGSWAEAIEETSIPDDELYHWDRDSIAEEIPELLDGMGEDISQTGMNRRPGGPTVDSMKYHFDSVYHAFFYAGRKYGDES